MSVKFGPKTTKTIKRLLSLAIALDLQLPPALEALLEAMADGVVTEAEVVAFLAGRSR